MIIWFFESAVVTGLLALAVALACRVAKPRPAVRHALWVAILVKALLPPLVAWPWSVDLRWETQTSAAPAVAIALEDRGPRQGDPSPSSIAKVTAPPPRAPESAHADPGSDPGRSLSAGPRFDSSVATTPEDSGSRHPSATTEVDGGGPRSNRIAGRPEGSSRAPSGGDPGSLEVSTAGAPLSLRFRNALPWVWALGAILLAALHALRLRAMARQLGAARPADPELVEEVEGLSDRLGVRAPRVLCIDGGPGPFVCGLLRPTLYWTGEGSPGASPVARRTVLTHELAHLRRRDPLYAWLDIVTGVVLWWNPIALWARKAMRECAEAACDAWVVHVWPGDRRGYAEALLEVSQRSAKPGPRPLLAVRSSAGRAFESRLRSILGGEPGSPRLGRIGAGAVALLAALWIPAWAAGPGEGDDRSEVEEAGPSGDAASSAGVGGEGRVAGPESKFDSTPDRPLPAPRDVRERLAKDLDICLDQVLEQTPGSAIAVAILRGDDRLARATRGEFEGLPMHPRTRVPVGSLSHVFVASYLTLLDRQGQLDLDAELGTLHGPWAEDPELSGIRVRHLLGHCSGLVGEGSDSLDPIAAVGRARVERAPGQGFRYWPEGVAALARVAEEVTGRAWAEGIEDGFLEPLGLCSTGYGAAGDPLGAEAVAYGMHSSLEDLGRFVAVQLQARSPEPLSAEALRELQEPAQVDGDWLNPRSLAWAQSWSAGTEEYLHWSSRRGADSCFVGFSKGHKVGVVILARGAGGLERLGQQLIALAVGRASATRAAWDTVLEGDFEGALPGLIALTEEFPADATLWFRRGYAELGHGDCRSSIGSFERALELGARRSHTAYNLGCAHARLGEDEVALDWIRDAIEHGFQNETLLVFDPDLDSLRGDPRFDSLRIADY